MRALIDDMKNERSHPGHPKLVVSNNSAAEGLVFAEKNSIETFAFDIEKIEDNLIFEETTLQVLKEKNIDIICLAGFMKILSEKLLSSILLKLVFLSKLHGSIRNFFLPKKSNFFWNIIS